MLSIIKNKMGFIGFLIFIIGTAIHFIFDYFYKIDLDPLASISFFVASALWTIDWECRKKTPRNWFVYLVIMLTFIVMGIAVFIYK